MSIKTKAKTSRSLLTPSVPEAGEIASVKDKRLQDHPIDQPAPSVSVALLTGGTDKDYAFGLASALGAQGVFMDFIASDEVDAADLRDDRIRSLNLRGSLERDASMTQKGLRALKYYFKLIGYAARAQPKIFHILWNNKFLFFDRTVLMLYYKLLGKKVAFTAHNVNAGKRDGNDSVLNRLSL